MVRTGVLLTCILGAMALSGCNRGNTLPDFESGSASGQTSNGASTSPFGEGGGIGVFEDDAGRSGSLLDELIVYFEFDRSEVPSQYNDMLAAPARYPASTTRRPG